MDVTQAARALLNWRLSSSSPLVKELRNCQDPFRCVVYVHFYLRKNPKFRRFFERSAMTVTQLIHRAKHPKP